MSIGKDNMNPDLTQIQIVTEINRLEQNHRRGFAVRRVILALFILVGFLGMLLSIWFPVLVTDQGSVVIGNRTNDVHIGEHAVVLSEKGMRECRIVAASGNVLNWVDSVNRVPADSYLVEMVEQGEHTYHLIQKRDLVAKIVCPIWPRQAGGDS